jgi:hypothetical protein
LGHWEHPMQTHICIEKDEDLQSFICTTWHVYEKRVKMVWDGTYWEQKCMQQNNSKMGIWHGHEFSWNQNNSWTICPHIHFVFLVWFRVFLECPQYLWVVVIM